MNKLDLESKDIVNENVEQIGKIFPNAITETKEGLQIDFDLLKQELSKDIIEGNKERYQLTWPGKKESIVLANTPSKNSLKPNLEKSVDFENTKNIYIEGDNLEVLKILQESYLGKIKCIYIDPPYNTGNDFIYNDDFKRSKEEEVETSDGIDEDKNRLITNFNFSGRYHSNWLSMMYPRLRLARNLLTDDGVIFISIDDNEVANLKKVCDEIFGENNFLETFIKKTTGGKRDSKNYVTNHEYLVTYAKSINKFKSGKKTKKQEKKDFKFQDENKQNYTIRLLRKWGAGSRRIDAPTLYYPLYYNGKELIVNKEEIKKDKINEYIKIYPMLSEKEEGRFRWGKETMKKNIEAGLVEIRKEKGMFIPYEKIYYTGKILEEPYISSISSKNNGARELDALGLKGFFDYPKSIEFIKEILNLSTNDSEYIILDFFSGSATTAHAVMQLNAEDGGNRKYIMVQIAEETDEKSEAYKAGYKNICEIGQERIRRAGAKIKEETGVDIDYGFRVYELSDSVVKDVYYTSAELRQDMIEELSSHIKEEKTAEDILTHVMLDLGLTLDLKVEERDILGHRVFYVDENSLVACFDKEINIDIVDEICKAEPVRIVFTENSFKDDNAKINVQERVKRLSSSTEISVI